MKNNESKRQTFTQWCRTDLFRKDIVNATAILQKALDAHLIDIYTRLNFAPHLSEGVSAKQLTEQLDYIDSAEITLDAMLERLSSKFNFIQKTRQGDEFLYQHVSTVPDVQNELAEMNEEIAEVGEEYLTTLEFLQFGNSQFEYSLKDDPEFLDRILSGREPEWADMWFRATNVDPLQNVHGIMGAVSIDSLFESGDILEIGGGTGNGIRNLFHHLDAKNELDRIHSYTFTDISQKFIMSTRKEIRKDFPDTKADWRFVDLNVPIHEQKIEPHSVDLIYAVNAAHVAKDIVAFLKNCKVTLRPGGRVLFAERIRLTPRDMAPRELALNLSIYHRTAAIRNSELRPMHCYLSPDNWLAVFKEAGFQQGEIWPDIELLSRDFPDQYAAIVTAIS